MDAASKTDMQLAKPSSRGGWWGLCAGSAAILMIWLVILPAVAAQPAFRARSARLEKQGIDAGAMFYTELEAADEIRRELHRAQRDHPGLLWSPF